MMHTGVGEALKGVEMENKSMRRIGGDPLGETRERNEETRGGDSESEREVRGTWRGGDIA